MTIWIDSREKAHAITKILADFDRSGVKHFVSKLPVGDYMSMDNARLAIDRKQNLSELCSNVCQQHVRFRNELIRANDLGIKLIILCEHGKGIAKLQDIISWENPRLKYSPMAVSGERLYKILSALGQKYNVDFMFCDKRHTGAEIVRLLGGNT